MLPLHSLILGKVKKLLNDTNIGILCIDGPTAAGKTILAEDLASLFSRELSIKVDFFRPKKLSTNKSILYDVINFTLDEFKRRLDK